MPSHRDLQMIRAGEWVPGVLLYGLSNLPLQRGSAPLWGDNAARRFELYGPGWHITGYSVHLSVWPPDTRWQDLVGQALDELVQRGAVVAWLGADEGCLATPPALFDPHAMAGCVLAFRTDDGRTGPVGALDEEIAPIDATSMAALRDIATRLVDRTVQDPPLAVWQVITALTPGDPADPAAVVHQVLGDDRVRRDALAEQIDRLLATGLTDDALAALIEEQVPAYVRPASQSDEDWLRALREVAPPAT